VLSYTDVSAYNLASCITFTDVLKLKAVVTSSLRTSCDTNALRESAFLDCSSAFLAQRLYFCFIFFRFKFSKPFSSSVIYSSLLLSTIYPSIGLFLGKSASPSSFFFQFFVFINEKFLLGLILTFLYMR